MPLVGGFEAHELCLYGIREVNLGVTSLTVCLKEFPRLTRLSLDNYVGRRGSPLSYSLHRQSGDLSLVQIHRDTVLSLVDIMV